MRKATPKDQAVYTFRIDRDQLDTLHEIAEREHRTVVQVLRVLVEQKIADHERQAA